MADVLPCLQHQGLNNPDIHYTFPIVKKKSEGLLGSADYARRWQEFLELGVYASWEDWLRVSDAGNSQPGHICGGERRDSAQDEYVQLFGPLQDSPDMVA